MSFPISRRLEAIQPFLAMEVMERAFELEREGAPVLHLEIGEPDFPPPAAAVVACAQALLGGETRYTDSRGLAELREAIAQDYRARFAVTVEPERGRATLTKRQAETKPSKIETVEPLGKRVLIRKDEDKKVTKGGIELPDSVEIPTITGRIVAVSAQVERDEDFPIRQYDRVLFNPKHAVPVEFDPDNCLFVVPIQDVVAVFRKSG